MHPVAAVGCIVLVSAMVAALIVVRHQVIGASLDAAARRRCAVSWFLSLCMMGCILWTLPVWQTAVPKEWALFVMLLPLLPPAVFASRDYAAIEPAALVKSTAILAAAGAAAAGSVTVLRPLAGEWAWGSPPLMALAALYWYLQREAGSRDALLGLVMLLALLGLMCLLVAVLERLGIPV